MTSTEAMSSPCLDAIDPQVRIGHAHLKVADLDRSLEFYCGVFYCGVFYCGVLGLKLMQHYGDEAAFISAGGYHHHPGLNSRESKNGVPPAKGTTELYHVALLYPNRRALAKALRRLTDAGIASDHGVSRAIRGALEHRRNPAFRNSGLPGPDGVGTAFRLRRLVELRDGKSGIGPEEPHQLTIRISRQYRLEHIFPAIGAVNIAGAQ